MVDLVFIQEFVRIALPLLTGVAPLMAAKLHLFKNDFNFTDTTALTDLVEADYTGYAAGAITWSAVTRADTGEYESIGQSPEFRPSSDVNPNTVYGFFITNTAGSELLGGGNFENAPLPMGWPLDSIIAILRLRPVLAGIEVTVS